MILFLVRFLIELGLTALLICTIRSVKVINKDKELYEAIWETDISKQLRGLEEKVPIN